MLDWNKAMRYVKRNLSLPSTFLEHSEKEIKEYIVDFTIPDFSNYHPDVERTGVERDNPKYMVSGCRGRYYFFDDEDLAIYGIKQCYFPGDGDMIGGHPIMGPTSFDAIPQFAVSVLRARFLNSFSDWNYDYKFIPPNMVEITNQLQPTSFAVEYMREQPHDLRRIPQPLERDFLDLALADIKIWIGNLRSHYGDGRITLPFGPELNLNGDRLKTDGEALRDKIIQKLTDAYIPPVIIDVG